MSDQEPPILNYARPMMNPPQRRPVRAFLNRVRRIYAVQMWVAAAILAVPLVLFFQAFGFVYGNAGIVAFLALGAWGGPFIRSHPWRVFIAATLCGCIFAT